MSNRVLICGLPNSGKTTYAKFLIKLYESAGKNYMWLNGDKVRAMFDDWDFSIEGRKRQTLRMKTLADAALNTDVIIDYVCPLVEYRKIIEPTHLVYIDTHDRTPYEDTKNIFEPVVGADVVVSSKSDIEACAKRLYDQLKM